MGEGKLGLDLLVGLTMFLLTFTFIANFIPGIFADVRRDITLAHETYKVAVILAETTGYWKNSTSSGIDWENVDVCSREYLFIPGLSKGQPDYLSFEKIKKLNEICSKCIEKCKAMLGLNVSNVNFHVSLESLYSKPYDRTLVKRFGVPLLDVGDPIPQSGDIVRFERYVYLDPIVGLTGALIIQTQKGEALPTPVCEAIAGDEKNVNCKFNLTYPLTAFTVKVVEYERSRDVSICVDVEEKKGACPIGKPGNITVQVTIDEDGKGRKKEYEDSREIVLNKTEDFLEFVNSVLGKVLKEGDKVYIRISVRGVDVEINIMDKFMADYIAGRAVAKLVIYGW